MGKKINKDRDRCPQELVYLDVPQVQWSMNDNVIFQTELLRVLLPWVEGAALDQFSCAAAGTMAMYGCKKWTRLTPGGYLTKHKSCCRYRPQTPHSDLVLFSSSSRSVEQAAMEPETTRRTEENWACSRWAATWTKASWTDRFSGINWCYMNFKNTGVFVSCDLNLCKLMLK